MAEVKPDGERAFLFIENHCPICAAATACQGLLRDRARPFPGGAGAGGRHRTGGTHRLGRPAMRLPNHARAEP